MYLLKKAQKNINIPVFTFYCRDSQLYQIQEKDTIGKQEIKPTQVRNKTKYFSYEDTLKIISYFSKSGLTIVQTTMNRGATGELAGESSELESELANGTATELKQDSSNKEVEKQQI